MTATTFGVTVRAEGEVRDRHGNIVERVSGTTTIEVPIADLQSFTDDQLREAGLDEHTINQIRSTP